MRWAASLDVHAPAHIAVIAGHVSVYLVAEDLCEDEESFPLKDYFKTIFQEELEAWCTDASFWPVRRDLPTFKLWFGVTVQSLVTDLAKGPVRVENI
jgi:hypothetical protein